MICTAVQNLGRSGAAICPLSAGWMQGGQGKQQQRRENAYARKEEDIDWAGGWLARRLSSRSREIIRLGFVPESIERTRGKRDLVPTRSGRDLSLSLTLSFFGSNMKRGRHGQQQEQRARIPFSFLLIFYRSSSRWETTRFMDGCPLFLGTSEKEKKWGGSTHTQNCQCPPISINVTHIERVLTHKSESFPEK